MSDADVRATVLQAVRESPLAGNVRDVRVEPAMVVEDEDYLRIIVSLQWPDGDVDEELEAMLERIEEAVAEIDDRYPSVRFLDAA